MTPINTSKMEYISGFTNVVKALAQLMEQSRGGVGVRCPADSQLQGCKDKKTRLGKAQRYDKC